MPAPRRLGRRARFSWVMLAHLLCADAIDRPRTITLETSLDSMGRISSLQASVDVEPLERHIGAGNLAEAKRLLDRRSASPRPGTRQLNIAGLLALLEGRYDSAIGLFEEALKEPFGPVHLVAQKSLYWAIYAHPDTTSNNDHVDAAWSAVIEAFQRSRDAAVPSEGLSIWDVGLQKQICDHPMYDRNRRARVDRGVGEADRWRTQYLDLVKKAVTDFLHRDLAVEFRSSTDSETAAVCHEDLERCESDWHIGQGAGRLDGPYAQKRLGGLVHLELLLENVFEHDIEGDIIEAGCFTGGTAVFLRAVLEQDKSDPPRRLLVADSFEGIPMPRTARGLHVDGPDVAHGSANWPERYAAGQSRVRSTFRRYGFWDGRVVLVPGFFNVSLPALDAPLALIHIDADAYESVLDALQALYPRLSPGGHVVIDDFHLPGVRTAVHDYRAAQGVTDPLWPVPTDYVTTCSPRDVAHHPLTDFQVEPVTVAYWTRRRG
eukprot:Transcript_31911.p1 GENE.Transcript_31911~~Transcript_31911.p1  ORF type:complete len:490 (-),score=40.07 Transcript_31911:1026-2495(-)